MSDFNLTIPGFTIACKSWGDKTLPPMLALHGWLDNAHSFAPMAPYLENKFHLIAVDLPGHGLSTHLAPGCNYHFIDGVFIIINIINALELEKLHLLGHSMGACFASLIAGVIPDRIVSVSLIEALGPFSSPEETCCTQLAQYAEVYSEYNNKSGKPYPSLELAAQARAKSGYLPMALARILCQRGVEEVQGQFYWRHDRRLIAPTPLRMTEMQIISCLTAISAKTCLIWADNGFEFNESEMQKRVNAVKNIIVHQIAGGHHLHMEKPDVTVERLVAFYNAL